MRKFLVFAAAVSCFLSQGAGAAFAAPERMANGMVFDAEFYAASYPDVVEQLGNEPGALFRHYLFFGKEEGRAAMGEEDLAALLQEREASRQVTVSFAGDCTLGNFKGQMGWNAFEGYYNQYGPGYYFQNVREFFENDDLTFVNLEGALTNYPQTAVKKFPIRGEPAYVESLLGGSIEVVNLANNHTFDCGQAGYDECRQLLTDHGIAYCGDSYTCVLERNGVRVGFLGLNCWEISARLDQSLQSLIAKLREQGCEVVCVMFHGGTEGVYTSNAVTEIFARHAVDFGADIVIGAHPHVLQGIEIYRGKTICYSLGNFCFGANRNPRDKDTFIFRQTFLVQEDGTVMNGDSDIVPCRISSVNDKNDYCPTPQAGAEGSRILQKIAAYSGKYGASYFQ